MKELKEYIDESLLGGFDKVAKDGDVALKIDEVMNDLIHNPPAHLAYIAKSVYGFDRALITEDNINFYKDGSIHFVNIPKDHILFLNMIFDIPECIKKYGIGPCDAPVLVDCYMEYRGNISDLNFVGKGHELILKNCKMSLDKIPQFDSIKFSNCSITNYKNKPSKRPKNCHIYIDQMTSENICKDWLEDTFKSSDIVDKENELIVKVS